VTDCVVLVPMLGRPWTVAPLVASLVASTDRARAVFIVTATDADVIDATEGLSRLLVEPRTRGDYAAKINTGVRNTTEGLILTGACDLAFRPGWLEVAEACMVGPVQVVGTNDMGNPRTITGPHSTHTLMSRAYAELPCIDGTPGPLSETYLHEYVDDELVGTAMKRGAYVHCSAAVVEHLHPMHGKAANDDIYDAQERRMMVDRLLFRQRRRLWV
jgi:hypothetical protein